MNVTVSLPLVPSVSVHEKDAVPSVVVVRDALATDVATARSGSASLDAVPAIPWTPFICPFSALPEAPNSVNVVVDGTVPTV